MPDTHTPPFVREIGRVRGDSPSPPQPGRVTGISRRVTFEDPSLPHQIVITLRGGGPQIAVSCNCLRLNGYGTRGAYEPIETRTRWEAAEAMAVWRAHLPAAKGAS